MNHTLRHIEYLISRHDCVIMPGIGAILSRYEGARFSEDGLSLLPPTRHLSFNPDLKENDGLLAHSISRSLSISYERGQQIMNDELNAMRHQLEVDGELSLGSLGRLSYDRRERLIGFEAAANRATNSMVAWLPSVKPVDVFMKARQDDEREEAVSRRRRVSPIGAFVRAACILIAFIALGIALTTPISVENTDYASLSIPEIKKPTTAKSPAQYTIYKQPNEFQAVDTASRAEYQRERAASRNASTVVAAEPTAEVKAVQPQQAFAARFNETDSYCVIIASLVTRAEADEFVAHESRRNKSARYGVIDKDGRYRVYVATGSTMAQAKVQASAWSSRYRGAWICSR